MSRTPDEIIEDIDDSIRGIGDSDVWTGIWEIIEDILDSIKLAETAAQADDHPESGLVILGGVRNAPSNYLRFERPVTVMGFDPMIQVIHERDVVSAIIKAVEPGVRGIFNLRGPGEAPLSRIFRILDRRPRSVPGPIEGLVALHPPEIALGAQAHGRERTGSALRIADDRAVLGRVRNTRLFDAPSVRVGPFERRGRQAA